MPPSSALRGHNETTALSLKEEGNLTRHQTLQCLGLVLPAFRTVRNKSVIYQPRSQWYFVRAA